jgi:hypothetical protein
VRARAFDDRSKLFLSDRRCFELFLNHFPSVQLLDQTPFPSNSPIVVRSRTFGLTAFLSSGQTIIVPCSISLVLLNPLNLRNFQINKTFLQLTCFPSVSGPIVFHPRIGSPSGFGY